MSKATITFSDLGSGAVSIAVSFGADGLDENSPAHFIAVYALSLATQSEELIDEKQTMANPNFVRASNEVH